jgi:molybdopterin synthase catalytic subunit
MDRGAGGIVLFVGTIRNRTNGREVKELEYEVYREMAERQIAKLESEVRKRWPVKSMTIVHREGKLKIGDISVVVAVSAVHRAEAFDAARYAIDRIKESFPIWKREEFGRGGYEWAEGTSIRRLPIGSRDKTATSTNRRGIVHRHRRILVEA